MVPELILPGVEVYVRDWKASIVSLADGGYRNRFMAAITSPPYKSAKSGLRRYMPVGHPLAHLEVGTEASVDQFVTGLCDGFDLFAEHLMHPAGSLWVNLGDAYAGSGGPSGPREGQPRTERRGKRERWPAKSLLLVPERFVLEMARRGWIVRNKPIWYKGKGVDDYLEDEGMPGGNSMPSSAPNRLKNTYEPWYHFVRSNRPIWWYHPRTCQIVSRKPRQEYEPVLDEQGNPVLTRSGNPKKRPLWVGMDYFYDLDAIREPLLHPDAANGTKLFGGRNKHEGYGAPTSQQLAEAVAFVVARGWVVDNIGPLRIGGAPLGGDRFQVTFPPVGARGPARDIWTARYLVYYVAMTRRVEAEPIGARAAPGASEAAPEPGKQLTLDLRY